MSAEAPKKESLAASGASLSINAFFSSMRCSWAGFMSTATTLATEGMDSMESTVQPPDPTISTRRPDLTWKASGVHNVKGGRRGRGHPLSRMSPVVSFADDARDAHVDQRILAGLRECDRGRSAGDSGGGTARGPGHGGGEGAACAEAEHGQAGEGAAEREGGWGRAACTRV